MKSSLAAGDDDGLAEVLQHEGEGGGGVGEGVGAVEDDEAVKVLVGALDVLGDDDPVVHRHVARVQERVVLVDGVDHPAGGRKGKADVIKRGLALAKQALPLVVGNVR